MSLVGPRPALPHQVEKYLENERRRLEVKPGITGWALVNGRNRLSWPERIKLDIWYIDHWSLWLDLKILLRTIWVVIFKREGVYGKDGITYNWMVQNKDGLKLGYKTDIGAFTYINAKNGVVIEDFVQIGSHCSLYSVSTIDNKEGQITLKKNCKIGSHSVLMPGVTIGENAIIGAFSFVNKDIPENVIAAGVPIKIIKKIKGK